MNYEEAWQAVLGQPQAEIRRASFDTWLRDTALCLWKMMC